MAFDSKRNEVVLLEGLDSTGRRNDTWLLSGRAWRRVDGEGPPARVEAFMAYDASRGVTVMFGGFGQSSPPSLGDTWEWDGKRWREVSPR